MAYVLLRAFSGKFSFSLRLTLSSYCHCLTFFFNSTIAGAPRFLLIGQLTADHLSSIVVLVVAFDGFFLLPHFGHFASHSFVSAPLKFATNLYLTIRCAFSCVFYLSLLKSTAPKCPGTFCFNITVAGSFPAVRNVVLWFHGSSVLAASPFTFCDPSCLLSLALYLTRIVESCPVSKLFSFSGNLGDSKSDSLLFINNFLIVGLFYGSSLFEECTLNDNKISGNQISHTFLQICCTVFNPSFIVLLSC